VAFSPACAYPFAMVALRKPRPIATMNLPAFLGGDSGDGSGRRWELREGVPEAMASARETHGAIQAVPGAPPRNGLLDTGRPCRVVASTERRAEPPRRGVDGTWPATAETVSDMLRLDSVGLTLPLIALYRTTAPDPAG